MILRTWRVINARYARDAFSGEGASKYGGRWNSIGVPVTYTSESIALACLEVLVGGIPANILMSDYVKIPVEFDASLVRELEKLPAGWNAYPPLDENRQIGDRWIKGNESLLLKVPNTIIHGEFNYMINPSYPDAKDKLKIGDPEEISFDIRLARLLG